MISSTMIQAKVAKFLLLADQGKVDNFKWKIYGPGIQGPLNLRVGKAIGPEQCTYFNKAPVYM